jgi:hypothetical protein
MLSFTDPFPIELAMLISGFWINNVSDMVCITVPLTPNAASQRH